MIKVHSIDINENEINIKADGINKVPLTSPDENGDPQPVFDATGVQIFVSQVNERIVVQFPESDNTDDKRTARLAAAMNGRLPDVIKQIRAKTVIQHQTILKLRARIAKLKAAQ